MLFDTAIELDPEQRSAFLRQAAPDDGLLREVESLLRALAEEEDRFEQPAMEHFAAQAEARTAAAMHNLRIGRYRLLRAIGHGGMGSVYEAVRADDEFQKRVAIKLVRRGMDTERIVHRFRQERQILAGLEHPNIARLLDGGVTSAAQPYFVLEYVEGRSITEYSAARGLPVPGRLRLFLQVCAPVQYAHQNLIVHRDLKPANILVTGEGTPKLLDFGVAKLMRADDESDAVATQAGFHAFTPGYASPEQIRGAPITTATDIYSLGVILYELLTGRRPFDFGDSSPSEIARVMENREPPRPSSVVRSGAPPAPAGGGASRPPRALSGELDSIVLKAMAADPGQRYSTAEALAEDVRRYLDGRPVLARQGTWSYRTRKFIGRNRVSVAAAALLVVSVAAGTTATVVQTRQTEAALVLAERRFHDVRELTSSLIFEVHDEIAPLAGSTSARALLVERGVEYLDRLYREVGADPAFQQEVAEAYLKLGDVQGNPTNPNLGELAAARGSFARSLALSRELVLRDGADARARHTLASAHERMGEVTAWTGDVGGGAGHLREALAHRTRLARMQPDSAATQLRLVISTLKLGDLLGHPAFPNLGDRAAALRQYDASLALLRRVPPGAGRPQELRRLAGLLHERRGRMLEMDGRYDEALAELGASRSIREGLARDDPANAEVLRDAGIAHERLCSVQLRRGSLDGALDHCQQALAVYGRLAAADPENVGFRTTLAIGQVWLARVLGARGEPAAALERLEESTAALRRVAQADRENLPARRQIARNHLHASALHAALASSPGTGAAAARRHRGEALRLYREGRAILLERAGGPVLSSDDRELLAQTASQLPDPPAT